MADVEWTPLPVPWAVAVVDRIPKQRYYDQDFYALETELFWPRVWQMACRLEEIPKPGDFVEYEILDQSIIVVRVDDRTVRAYYNSCRHRGMKLVEGSGSRRTFVCPFHGWCWGLDGKNTFVLRSEMFDEDNLVRLRTRACAGPVRAVGWLRVDQSRRRRTTAARLHRTVRLSSTTSARCRRCAPSGGSRACCR